MNKNKTTKVWILLLVAIFLVIAIFFIIFIAGKDKKKQIIVGFVMTGDHTEAGWNGMHYNAICDATKKLDMKLLLKENVHENNGECKKAVNDLISDGAQIIILSSYNYASEVHDIISDNPSVQFLTNSPIEHKHDNVSAYFVRMYQARYLAGIVAGLTTKTDKIGYVAAMDNSEVNRGINAFALGVLRVNKDARVIVSYTGSWDDKTNEYTACENLYKDENIDVVTYHQNRFYVAEKADELGIYSIGYHYVPDNMSDRFLTAVVCKWSTTYEKLLKFYSQGTLRRNSFYWLGIDEDAVGLTDFSSTVSKDIRDEVEKAKEELLSGFEVFSGNIVDNKGNVQCQEGELISDIVLFENMDWLLEGVRVYEE